MAEPTPAELAEARRLLALGQLEIRDRYRETRPPKESKGIDRRGEEVVGFAYSPDRFVTSSTSRRGLRYYIELPSGAVVHPDTLSPGGQQQLERDTQRNRKQYAFFRLDHPNLRGYHSYVRYLIQKEGRSGADADAIANDRYRAALAEVERQWLERHGAAPEPSRPAETRQLGLFSNPLARRKSMRNPSFGGLFGRRRPRYRSIAEGREAYNRLGPTAYWAQFGRQPQAWELEDRPRRRRRRRRNPDHGDILDLALPALVLVLLIRGGTLRPAA